MPTTLPLFLLLAQAPAQTPAAPAAPSEAPVETRAAGKALLLRGATVHTMLPGDAPRVMDVLVVDGRIRTLAKDQARGTDLEVLELHGKHVLPGLIDAHVNFDPEHDALYLAAGVTLVRDLGGDHVALQREREPARRDAGPGPALLSAGAFLDGDPPASATAVVLRNPDAVEAYLPILFEEDADFVSVLPGLSEDVWHKVIALAHAAKRTVFGPRPPKLTLAAALAGGQDGFHSLDSLLPPGMSWDDPKASAVSGEVAEAVAELARAKKALVPLLHASALRLDDQEAAPEWRALLGLLGPSYEPWWRTELAQRRAYLAPEHRGPGELTLEKQARALRALFDAGAVLLPGSGAPQPWLLPGTALHQELSQWVQAGIPPASVLDLATRGAAEALGLAGQRGTLQPGAWADLVVLDEDPRGDLARLLDPAFVVVRGRALARAELQARLARLGERQIALRAERERPVEVEPPPQAEEGVVVLEGTVESRAYGLRMSTERYRVVRLPNDAVLYTTRIVHAAEAGGSARELTLEQFVSDGRLAQVHATLREGDDLLEHDGLWTANSWRMQSRLNGRIVNAPAPFREQPVCVDASSVTSLLILGQTPLAERVPVVQLHPGFDCEAVNWRLELDPEGMHRVRTQLGYKAFRLDAVGALEFAVTKIGNGLVETHALSASAFGGAGLPLPRDKRRAAPAGAPPPSGAPLDPRKGEPERGG